jgi:glycosyltransferase involved in cell wall biosynthesis
LLSVIPSEAYGGAERYGVKIAVEAAAQGWDVRVALRDLEVASEIRRELAVRGVRSLRLVDGRRVRGGLGFGALLLLHRPDVVHITAPWPLAFLEVRVACATLGVPTVVVNALIPDLGELTVIHPHAFRWTRRRRQTWVAFSRHGASVLTEAYGLNDPSAVRVIYNGVRRPHAAQPLDERSAGRARFGLDAADFVIVDVARLSREKGIDVLIDAVAQLAPDFPELRLLIAGEGTEGPVLEAQIARLGVRDHVRLLGRSDAVESRVGSADLFAFRSSAPRSAGPMRSSPHRRSVCLCPRMTRTSSHARSRRASRIPRRQGGEARPGLRPSRSSRRSGCSGRR